MVLLRSMLENYWAYQPLSIYWQQRCPYTMILNQESQGMSLSDVELYCRKSFLLGENCPLS
jgi:hypothetical protein